MRAIQLDKSNFPWYNTSFYAYFTVHSIDMRFKLMLFLIIACLGCKSTQKTTTNKPSEVENKNDKGQVTIPQLSVKEYIDLYKEISIREMNSSGIPASITLAQAILESGIGKSYLATYAKNHFGIKCGNDWTGETVYKQDDDESASCFRKYPKAEVSFNDHTQFLIDPKKSHRYGFLFDLDKKDYKAWAKGLQQSGYASNKQYASRLITLIEKYELHEFDTLKKDEMNKSENVTDSELNKIHIVVEGDTLYNLAIKYNATVAELIDHNHLDNEVIKLGQELSIPD